MLDTKDEVLTTMAGSFGYAAPEIMLKKGHGKPVDMWSLGVITYTLLCGYSPFRAENLQDLVEECCSTKVVFHERYWKDVSADAKNFIGRLLQPKPEARASSKVLDIGPLYRSLGHFTNMYFRKLYGIRGLLERLPLITTYSPKLRHTWRKPAFVVELR
jgi:serine/threonine protein kinase